MRVIDTNAAAWTEKRPGWSGVIFSSDNMTFAHWRFAKGADIHRHDHEQEEVWHVVEGELQVDVADKRMTAGPGVVVILPANTPHAVTALSDGLAIVADYPLRPGF